MSPYSEHEIFMSCDMSQLFHTTTFGGRWNLIDFRQIQVSGGSGRIEFTSDPLTLYTRAVMRDASVPYRSTDGGRTWGPVPTDPTAGDAWNVVADPTRSDRLLVSDYSTIYLSTDGGATFHARYTVAGDTGCHVAGAYFDEDTIVVGIGQGLVVSTDGGLSFARMAIEGVGSDERIVSFTGASDGGTVRFYAVTLEAESVYPGVTGAEAAQFSGLYALSRDASAWTSTKASVPSTDYPFFVACSRANPNVAYAAGGSAVNHPTVLKTTDGGATWSPVLRTSGNMNVRTGWSGAGGDRDWSFGEYALGFAVSPITPDRAIITDLGFAHVTSDGGASWRQAYIDSTGEHLAGQPTPSRRYYRSVGLENTACWHVEWADSTTMIGCFTDIRGTRSTDGGTTWSFDYAGHTLNTMYHAIRHPANGNVYAAVSSIHDLYQSTYLQDIRIDRGTGSVLSSSNGGSNWTVLHDFGHPVVRIALDSAHPDRMYASVVHSTQGGIFVSDNIQDGPASTWSRLTTPSRTEGHPFDLRVLRDGTILCSYSGRRNSSGSFTASSGIFTSTDGGVTWNDRSAASMQYWTKDIVVDPHDVRQDTWYVGVFSGWGGPPNGLGGLYRTTNRGSTWERILDRDRVTSISIDPNHADVAYVTTETEGLWYTADLQSGEPTFNQLASYPFRQPERVYFNPYRRGELWVCSFGNGLRRGTVTSAGVDFDSVPLGPLNLW